MNKMVKQRIDVLLVERGLLKSRALAQRMVMAGQIRANDQVILKASTKVDIAAKLEVSERPRFVSRGGEKLAKAIEEFGIRIEGRTCADAGASTGGFTDCLLRYGASKVYSIDVGHGILDWKLRQDSRVVVMERTNVRYLDKLPEPVDLVTIDASFISLKLLIPVVINWFADYGEIVVLIKPQFEAGRRIVSRGAGVVRDPDIHNMILLDILNFALEQDLSILGGTKSPLLGPKGNVEFLAWFSTQPGQDVIGVRELVDELIAI